jgi:hypothetical protein
MKKGLFFIALLMLFGCTKREAVQVDIKDICSPDNEKKYVSTSGYLDDKGGVFCSNIGSGRMNCGFAVLANAGGDKVFSADIQEGSGADEVEKLERSYKKEDIKIRDDKGQVISLSDKVKLIGEMSITAERSVCFMTVDKIER